jgi:hypothetical protein
VSRRPPVVVDAPVVALERRVAALERIVAASRPRACRAAARPRADRDAAVIVALADAVAGRLFTAREAFAHRSASPALAQALTDARIGNARQLGKVFQRVEGSDIGGVFLERVTEERDGIVYVITATTAITANPLAGQPRSAR